MNIEKPRYTVVRDSKEQFNKLSQEFQIDKKQSTILPTPIGVKQRTETWYDLRNYLSYSLDYISATDAATVMKIKRNGKLGYLQYLKNRKKLIIEKQQKQNFFSLRGIQLEPYIIRKFISFLYNYTIVGCHYLPGIVMTSQISSLRLFCSPDFAFSDLYNRIALIECKYWNKSKHLPLQYSEIPLEYIIQVIVQLLVTNADVVYLVFLQEDVSDDNECKFYMTSFEFFIKNTALWNSKCVTGPSFEYPIERHYFHLRGEPLRLLYLFQQLLIHPEDSQNYKEYYKEYINTNPPTHEDLKKIISVIFMM